MLLIEIIRTINELKKFGITGKFLSPNNNIISIDNKIRHIKDITKEWEIKMSKRAKGNYEYFKRDK